MGGFAWVTLATNDSYSLGALVLAHSLRRAGTTHDLVALVTPGVSAAMRGQLSSVFNVVQEVNVLDSRDEANLALLERPDLGITFTKLHCWRLTQYEKCVFLDADTLVLKNCDELFEREELSAAPDPGWPDCFNSGVFVYRPSVDTFNALIKFALAKGSFDGGDQGLLNMFFSDWATKDISRHLPFIYNMVATATYSYLPAYKQYGENAKIVHFIGAVKPWLQYFDSETRLVQPPHGSEHMRNLLQLWWDIFCSTVHPSLSPDMLGLAGALSQLTLGAPRSAEQTAFEEHMRKQAWEQGSMDYMGRDSFENIWRKIEATLAQAPSKPEEATEVPPTKSSLEPKIPEPKLPETQTTTLPPSAAGDAPEVPSSTAEPTAPALQSSQRTELSSDSALPKTTEPSAPAPLGGPIPPPSPGDQDKVTHPVPHTPLVTEATPPTSPPIVIPELPKTDTQALKVDTPSLETPPVGSTPSDLVSVTPITSTVSEDVTQATTDTAAKSVATQESVPTTIPEVETTTQEDIPEQSIPSTPPVAQQVSPTPLASQQSDPSTPATQQAPITPPIPLQAPSTPPVSLQAPPTPPIPLQAPPTPPIPLQAPSTPPIPLQAPSTPPVPLQAPSTPPIPLQAPSTPPAVQPAPPTPPAAEPAPPTPPAAQPAPPTPPAAEPAPPTPPAAQPAPPTPPAAQPAPPTPPAAQPAPPTPPATQPAPPTPPAAQPAPPTPPAAQPAPPTPPAAEPAPPTPPAAQPAPPTPPAAQPAPPTPPAAEPAPPTPPAAQPAPPTPPAAQTVPPAPSAPEPAPPTPSAPEPAPPTPPAVQLVPSIPPAVQPAPPTPPAAQQAPPTPQQAPPVPPAAQQAPTTPSEAQKISSALKEAKPTDVLPTPPQSPQTKSLPPTEQVSAVPSIPTETKSTVTSTPSKQASELTPPPTPSPKTTETKSAEQKDASVPSTKSKTEEPPKAAPSKPSAPAPPPSDAPPSDQAPVPPKRKGHKGAGTSTTDQGAASKPAAQPQQSKGSKPGQKGKK